MLTFTEAAGNSQTGPPLEPAYAMPYLLVLYEFTTTVQEACNSKAAETQQTPEKDPT